MDNADFATTALPSGTRDQVPHFERYWADDATVQWGWCPPEENRVRPATQDRDALKLAIQTSKMNGGTGTDIGMKYGVAFLDPANRSVLETMATQVPAADRPLAGRPLDWDDPSTQKYIVLMTDGGITAQYRPKMTGLVDDDEDDEDNETDVDDIDGIDYDKINAEILIHKQSGQLSGNGGQVTKRNKNASLDNFYAMCDAAKANGVTVFTIAYNAPVAAQTQMQNCASSASLFYNIENLDVAVAFGSIALQINRLRLTN